MELPDPLLDVFLDAGILGGDGKMDFPRAGDQPALCRGPRSKTSPVCECPGRNEPSASAGGDAAPTRSTPSSTASEKARRIESGPARRSDTRKQQSQRPPTPFFGYSEAV